jgi:hypothetical protein
MLCLSRSVMDSDPPVGQFTEDNLKIIFQILDSNKTMFDDNIQASFSSYTSKTSRHFLYESKHWVYKILSRFCTVC